MISPRIGSRVRAQRCARGFVAFSLAAGLLVTPQFLAVSPASAAIDEVISDAVQISLSTGLHGVIEPGSPLLASITITNDTDTDFPAGLVTVELNRTPITDSAALASWLDAGASTGTFAPVNSESSTVVAASASATMSVVTPAAALGELDEGVYPLRVTLHSADSENAGETDAADLTATSVLIVNADSTAQVSVIVPLTATPADGGLLTAEELTTLTAADGALTAQLDGVAGTPAALAIDPLIPAAIRVLGSAAPQTATAWLERLDALPNERFALQSGDADATVQAQAGLPGLLTPLSFSPYIEEKNFVELPSPTPSTAAPGTGTATPTPTPSSTPAAPEIPTDDELIAIDGAESGILWPLGDLRTADIEVFTSYLESDATTAATTIIPSTAVSAPTSAAVEIDGHRLLVLDARASEALSEAATTEDAEARERKVAEGIAELSFTDVRSPLLIGLDRDENRPADALRETILSLSAIAAPLSFSELRAVAPASVTLAGGASTDRAAALGQMLAEETHLTAFSSILDDPQVMLAPERLQILRLIGVGASEEYAEAATAHQEQTRTTLNAVSVQQPSPVQLFTAAAPLPVWVRNDLPWRVNVRLTSLPSDARLDVQPLTEVVAQPASNERVKVPVEARVGSGELEVSFSLSSPTGVPIGTDQTAKVTVRAEWEGIGLGILGGIIGVLLILGIVRTVIRRRRDADSSDDSSRSDAAEEQVTGE
ncbi:DUF6049 family protein [Microbacterium sp. A82]|uniref:DUF6049 family protein n=1 Tax=Microbacterium sp. A82 TaxID=3450452 RepID=UPI003F31E448